MSLLKKIFGRGDVRGDAQISPLLTERVEKPQTSMSELLVRAIIPVTKDNWLYVKNVMAKQAWLENDPDLNEIFRQHAANTDAVGEFIPCDDPKYPILIDDNKTRVQMWKRRGMNVDGRNLLMVKSNVVGTPEKVITFMPQQLVRGTAASFVMIYRMSCCSEGSYSALMSVSDKAGEKNMCSIIDSNVRGIKEGMGRHAFNGKIGIAREAETQDYLVQMHDYIQHFNATHGIVAPK